MKTKPQIEAALQELRHTLDAKCNCAETGHAEYCKFGGVLVTGIIDALNWVADNPNSFDEMMDGLRAIDRQNAAEHN